MSAIAREAAHLRRSVEHEDFAAVEASLARYAGLLEAEPSLESLSEASELIEWARRNLCAARTRIAEQRDRLRGVAQYCGSASPAAHLLHIDA